MGRGEANETVNRLQFNEIDGKVIYSPAHFMECLLVFVNLSSKSFVSLIDAR